MSRPSRSLVTAIAAVAAAVTVFLVARGPPGSDPDASAVPPPMQDRVGPTTPPADHHVHIWSADARDVLVRAQRALGQEVIGEDQVRVLSADDAIAGLDSAGVERGVLLSNAYFFGVPEVDVEGEHALVRAENDYVGRQAAEHPERLTAFLSVNPLADYALEEIDRLADHGAFVGLKLHLGNSDVDLRDSDDIARLREIFARADEHDLALAIHLGGRSDSFGAHDAEAFLDEVLPAAPDVPVQVAHMGGPGGFGAGTRASARAFAAALEAHPERTRNLVFDLSGVPHPRFLAQGDTALVRQIEQLNRAFVEVARELGFNRVIYGSDYPAIPMSRYLEGLRRDLPLTDAEFRDLVDDPAPYLR